MKLSNEVLKGQILAYVCEYVDNNGYSPSFRDIQKALGVRSVSTVHRYAKILEAENKLDMKANSPRALAACRKVILHGNSTQRLRVDIADGGSLFLDCTVERNQTGTMDFRFCGVLDASQLKGTVGSVVGCHIERE